MDMKSSPLATLNDPSLLKTDALIGGDWVKGSARFEVHRPGHRRSGWWTWPTSARPDAQAAIAAANKAWPAWRARPRRNAPRC